MRTVFIFFLALFFFKPVYAAESYAALVDEVAPAIVNISTEKEIFSDEEDDDTVDVKSNLSGKESLGSGFFIRHDGYILTNYHVIQDTKTITVTTNDGKNYTARTVGIDTLSDLAVLKIDNNKKFAAIKFGDIDEIQIGDTALTFGNPYGAGVSVSAGIISSKVTLTDMDERQYIQTDAVINSGNSGGPLLNPDGEVIGINTVLSPLKNIGGFGVAVPSNIANWVSSQLIDNGKVQRGWLGLNVSYGIDRYTDKSGFLVTEINEESDAYKQGIRVGDIILSYNDKPATDINAFRLYVETLSIGQALRLKTSTLGEEVRNVVRIQNMPDKALKEATSQALAERNNLYHQELDGDVFYLSDLHIVVKEATPRGLMIMKLERKSPLTEQGVKIGDIILEANRNDIFSVDNILDVVHNAVSKSRPISFLIQHIDETFYINIEVTSEND